MTGCDINATEIILGFSVVGLTLKFAIDWLRTKLRLKGFLALAFAMAICFAASAVYILVTKGSWDCLIFYGLNVFAGTQIAYRALPKKK